MRRRNTHVTSDKDERPGSPDSDDVASGEPRLRVIKLYDVVRTAHLERIAPHSQVTILFVSRRYDFDLDVAEGVDARQAGVMKTFLHCLRHDADVIEINEPVIARAAPRALAAIVGNRLRSLHRRGRASVVTYAIANKDAGQIALAYTPRQRAKWRAQWALVPWVWRSVDRIAFGTEGARENYARCFRSDRRWPEARTILALPAPTQSPSANIAERGMSAVFVGDLSARKGIPELLDAWPLVRTSIPTATLAIIGKGALQDEVARFASATAGVELSVDPPRERILAELPTCRVLVLLSQSTPRWREQVGLPIVEGLSSGCVVVTTSETGLADWLEAHGHVVLESDAGRDAVAAGIRRALESPLSPREILGDLPAEDGRAEAERWLYAEGRRVS